MYEPPLYCYDYTTSNAAVVTIDYCYTVACAVPMDPAPPRNWRLDQPASLFRFPRAMRLGPRPQPYPLQRAWKRRPRSPPRYGCPV